MTFSRKLLENEYVKQYGRLMLVALVAIVGGVSALAYNHHQHSVSSTCLSGAEPNCGYTSTANQATNQTQGTASLPASTPSDSPAKSSGGSSRSYVPPSLPKAQEDPTLAWYDKYVSNAPYITDKLSQEATNLDSVLSPCGTINPYSNSICIPTYNANPTLNLCQTLQNDTSTALGYPPIPLSTANNSWQGALNSFSSAASTCISNITNNKLFTFDQIDIGYSVKNALLAGVQGLEAMITAVTQYEKTL